MVAGKAADPPPKLAEGSGETRDALADKVAFCLRQIWRKQMAKPAMLWRTWREYLTAQWIRWSASRLRQSRKYAKWRVKASLPNSLVHATACAR